MRVVIIRDNEVNITDIKDELDEYYRIIGCDCIDIVNMSIGDKKGTNRFDIICDDDALLKGNPRVSAIDKDHNPILFGNLIVAGEADDEGELTSLTDEDCDFICEHVLTACSYEEKKAWKVLQDVSY